MDIMSLEATTPRLVLFFFNFLLPVNNMTDQRTSDVAAKLAPLNINVLKLRTVTYEYL
jgi:hypothetical protein